MSNLATTQITMTRETLVEALRASVRSHRARPAIVDAKGTLSFGELDARSDAVALQLHRSGIRSGSRIGLLRRKDADCVACIYGILKAGCAYVPLDPKSGLERLLDIVRDAQLAGLFTEPAFEHAAGAFAERELIASIWGADSDVPWASHTIVSGDREALRAGAEAARSDAAYVLYTSGSTGAPKGVEHDHASAMAFAAWAVETFAISPEDRLSCHAPLHFDLTTLDLFASLIAGAAVILIPGEQAIFPRMMADSIQRERISVWYSVPFALMQLLQLGESVSQQLRSLREVVFAGERFPPDALRRLAHAVPQARLTNLFGPTETNVCTWHRLTDDDLRSDEFCPIGLACSYAITRIVDQQGAPAAPGETGELQVGGPCVMRGYLNRPELNRTVFTTDDDGVRWFRTGDLVSVAAEGEAMRFHGRRDRQVKVRGMRLELDEIEGALLRHEDVRMAVAWVEKGQQEFDYIAAAVEVQGRPLAEAVLREHVQARLSRAAVPARIMVLDEMPRSPNGKVDRQALAKLSAARI